MWKTLEKRPKQAVALRYHVSGSLLAKVHVTDYSIASRAMLLALICWNGIKIFRIFLIFRDQCCLSRYLQVVSMAKRKLLISEGLFLLQGNRGSAICFVWTGMFELDHSAARGKMAARALIVFKHESELGNAPAHKLFDAVSVKRKDGVSHPRSFYDYEEIAIDEAAIPSGIEVQHIL